MRILSYIHVEDFPGLGCQDFNLDGDYEFSLKGRNLHVRPKDAIGDEFYSKSGTVYISCVVGSNGAGKTSLARLFYELSLSIGLHKVIIVVREGLVLTPYEANFKRLNVSVQADSKVSVKEVQTLSADSLANNFAFGYFSPVYTTQHFVANENTVFADVSTTFLLRNTPVGEEDVEGYGLDRSQIFDVTDTMRILSFVERAHSLNKEDALLLPIRVPDMVLVGPNEYRFKVMRDEYKRHLENVLKRAEGAQRDIPKLGMTRRESLLEEPINNYCKKVVELCDIYDKADVVAKILICFVVASSYDSYLGLKNTPKRSDGELIDLATNFVRDKKHSWNSLDPNAPLRQLLGSLMELVEWADDADKNFIKIYLTNDGKHVASNVSGLKVNSGRNAFFKFVMHHSGLKDKTDFVSISTHPNVSSGEWNIALLFSRLMCLMQRIKNRSIVIFMDEAETSLHPDWQRKLVESLIRFFERFNNGNAVHLVFLTHSPILLSDIPKGNVTFLCKDRIGGDGATTYTKRQMESDVLQISNTFGANIFDLLRKSFFLPDGTVGEFAQDKLSALTRKIYDMLQGEKSVLSDEDRVLMRLVGDEYLHRYFDVMESIVESRHCR